MLGSMLSFDEKLNDNVPFYHSLWAYPLFAIGVAIILIATILTPIIMLFSMLIDYLCSSKNKFLEKSGKVLGAIISSPLMLGFLCIIPIGNLNKYYNKKELMKNEKHN